MKISNLFILLFLNLISLNLFAQNAQIIELKIEQIQRELSQNARIISQYDLLINKCLEQISCLAEHNEKGELKLICDQDLLTQFELFFNNLPYVNLQNAFRLKSELHKKQIALYSRLNQLYPQLSAQIEQDLAQEQTASLQTQNLAEETEDIIKPVVQRERTRQVRRSRSRAQNTRPSRSQSHPITPPSSLQIDANSNPLSGLL